MYNMYNIIHIICLTILYSYFYCFSCATLPDTVVLETLIRSTTTIIATVRYHDMSTFSRIPFVNSKHLIV